MAFQNRTGLHAAFPSGLCGSLAANYAEGIPQKPSGEFQKDERGDSRTEYSDTALSSAYVYVNGHTIGGVPDVALLRLRRWA